MAKLIGLVLVRHGETTGESSIRYHGINDVELSKLGRAQAEAARLALEGEEFDELFASPLSRARETARIILPGRPIRLVEDFREVNFGRWEGLTQEEIADRDPELYDEWRTNPRIFGYPGGDSRSEFLTRVGRGLRGLLAGGATYPLVVAHKGVIRALAAELLGEELAGGEPELGAILRLEPRPGEGWRITGD